MKFRLSSRFGVFEEVRNGREHHGIDLAMPENTTLRSIVDGVVERVVDYGNENLGKGVIIKLQDGTKAIYGHMNDISVKAGERLAAGDVIGLSGNTGHSTGAHLHFGLKAADGSWIDPTPYAETLANISGEVGNGWTFLTTPLGAHIVDKVKSRAQEEATNLTTDVALGVLEGLRDVVLDLSFGIALIGGGLCILFKVAGWEGGYRWASILFVAHVLIRFILGG
jgi:hypothetical protein